MGCDIHAHIEQKIDGKWEHYTKLRLHRWYRFFRAITGNVVRTKNHWDSRDCISDCPHGLPLDISVPTKWDRKECGSDGNNDSWLTREELVNLEKWLNDNSPTDIGCIKVMHSFGWFYGNWFDDLPDFVEDVRMVFWFDN